MIFCLSQNCYITFYWHYFSADQPVVYSIIIGSISYRFTLVVSVPVIFIIIIAIYFSAIPVKYFYHYLVSTGVTGSYQPAIIDRITIRGKGIHYFYAIRYYVYDGFVSRYATTTIS